ncbi:MAG TPA: GNAT family N-acetyltransferase [Microlunatus sp.]
MAGIDELEIRPFSIDDVDSWARTDLQRQGLVHALEISGDYLAAVQQPDGRIVGKIGIRYEEHPGAGNLLQFDVVEDLRGRGIGTALLRRAEEVARERGCTRTTLAVEETNGDGLRLYRRLGYQVFGAEDAEWDQEAPDGSTYRYRCRCLLMQRTLTDEPGTGR